MTCTNNFKKGFVAFLDILGVQNFVNQIRQNEKLCKSLINALKINTKFGEKKITSQGEINLRTSYFSDSIIFVMERKWKKLPHLFLIIRYLQDQLWLESQKPIFLRGAVVLNDVYWSEENSRIFLGTGIVEAYKIESQLAIYPRIVIDKPIVDYITQKELVGYPFTFPEVLLKEVIFQDQDGIYFLDLLSDKILRPTEESFRSDNNRYTIYRQGEDRDTSNRKLLQIIDKLNNYINKKLENENDKKILQKLYWFYSYLKKKKKTLKEVKCQN